MKFTTASLVTLSPSSSPQVLSKLVDVSRTASTLTAILKLSVCGCAYYGCIRQGNQPIDCRNNCQLP
ncbi:hypothetical protein BGZ74_001244 [Mortierella antarctica]|nr:hypothetical protein BGZ74_001244 [Mortierella antarctica]